MITYIALLVTCFGALAGLAGSSWDKDKAGYIKLTIKGWISLFTILAGLCISAYTTHEAQVKADLEATQRNEVAKIGREELGRALSTIVEPFEEFLAASGKLNEIKGMRYDEYRKRALEYVATEDARIFFEKADFLERPEDDVGGREYATYAEAIEYGATKTPDELDRLFTRYANYLSPREIIALRTLTTHYYFIELQNLHNGIRSFGETEIFSRDSRYIEFFSILSALGRGKLSN